MIYEPREDSFLLQRNLSHYVFKKNVLDMGAGSGIQSETAIKLGATSVLAVDIDPLVIEHLKKKHIPAIKSDLFLNVSGTYDVIVFNPPYLPLDEREDVTSARITAGGKKGDEVIIKCIKQSPKHLSKKGIVLIILSSLTPHKRLFAEAKKSHFTMRKVDQLNVFMETLELWEFKRTQ